MSALKTRQYESILEGLFGNGRNVFGFSSIVLCALHTQECVERDLNREETSKMVPATFTETLKMRDTRLAYVKQTNIGRLQGISVSPSGEFVWVHIGPSKEEFLTIEVPMLHSTVNGLKYTNTNGVERAVGSWMINEVEVTYWQLMNMLFCADMSTVLNTRSRRPYFDRLAHSFRYKQSAVVFSNFQKVINDIINRLPLVSTDMQKWAMCNRIQVIDPSWETLSPDKKLTYQVGLNYRMFPFTSLGQSDSGMCQNTLLKVDVRKTIPFGIRHHNPHRNLYQTLGMRGDETPVVMSHTERALADEGIVRKGWNLLTAFIDVPSNFEDQIIVSTRLADLTVTEHCSFSVFGSVMVNEGDNLFFLQPLAIEPDGSIVRFNRRADSAFVEKVSKVEVNFDGKKREITRIRCSYKRLFKDGVKLTNRHGNKGIIHITDTGYIKDPVRGNIPIDIIVSASSVRKRKNFGQLYEALLTLLRGVDEDITLADKVEITSNSLRMALKEKGYSEDGTVEAVTKWGTHKVVAGWVHWGCIKTPEDQLWSRRDTLHTNNNDVRTAGNKVSHIELKALTTIFGKKNPVTKEILEHRQGEGLVFSVIEAIEKTVNQPEDGLPIVKASELNSISQKEGCFHQLADFTGTISDVTKYPEGFWLALPDGYGYLLSDTKVDKFGKTDVLKAKRDTSDIVVTKVFIPRVDVRKPWKHVSGLYGFNDTSALINNLIASIQQMEDGEANAVSRVGRNLYLYFTSLSAGLTGKSGLISTYAMAVRYPDTVKATASVSEYLEPNEIEIHENMAFQLKVKEGDFVLVERFPCLGFMSIRVQKIKITSDPMAKYVIRVSGNSLASQNLDFDGDVIYLMSFSSPEAKKALEHEFYHPADERKAAYDKAANKAIPHIQAFSFDDYDVETFPDVTKDRNAEIVAGLTGIKRGTGTVVALCYNIMRILERTIGYDDKYAVGMELLLDKVANSVFSQKHAGRSLEAEAKKAICLADTSAMIELGFDKRASKKLAEIVKSEARSIGISESKLAEIYYKYTANGGTSIINMIVRRKNKVWFASRSSLPPVSLTRHLRAGSCDISSHMFTGAQKLFEAR